MTPQRGRELARQGQADTLAAAALAHVLYPDEVRDALDHCIDHSAGAQALWGNGFTAEDVRDRLTPNRIWKATRRSHDRAA